MYGLSYQFSPSQSPFDLDQYKRLKTTARRKTIKKHIASNMMNFLPLFTTVGSKLRLSVDSSEKKEKIEKSDPEGVLLISNTRNITRA